MQVSVEKKEGLRRLMKVVIPATEITKAFDDKVNSAMKDVKLDGFRAGKVPRNIVVQRFGGSIRNDIINDVMRKTLFEATKEKELNLAGAPTIESLKADEGKDLEYEASFEIFPEIKLEDLSGVEVERIAATIADKDIDNLIEQLRQQRANWNPVERAAIDTDQVIIDFEGSIDGKPSEGASSKDLSLVLGSNSMIPGFEKGIIGAKTGDEFELNLSFPKDYHAADVAGKSVVFKIKVQKVNEVDLPEINEAFLKAFGVTEGGMDKLRENFKTHMTKELENTIRMRNKTNVFDKLIEKNNIELPQVMIDDEIKSLYKESQQHGQNKVDDNAEVTVPEEAKKALEQPAARRVKLGFLVREFIQANELKPNADQVKKLIENMASSYEDPTEFVKWYHSDRQRMTQIEAAALEDQAVEALFSQMKAVEKTVNYKEVMERQA